MISEEKLSWGEAIFTREGYFMVLAPGREKPGSKAQMTLSML
jgi:hypothetical protein